MNPTLEQIKTDESVWPEGADFYIPESGIRHAYFIKKIGSDLVYKLADFTDNWARHKSEIPLPAIPRPTKAFVPEVGVECEYSVNGGDWGSCSLIASYKDRHWIAINDIRKEAVWNSSVIKFRPIKSERELLIDIIEANGNMSNGVLADNILKAGFVMEPTK